MLGGDISLGRSQRPLGQDERAFLTSGGRVSEIATLRATARGSMDDVATAEIKAVDAAYPLVGAVGQRPVGVASRSAEKREWGFRSVGRSAVDRAAVAADRRRLSARAASLCPARRDSCRAGPHRHRHWIWSPRDYFDRRSFSQRAAIHATLMRWITRLSLAPGATTPTSRLCPGRFPDASRFGMGNADARKRFAAADAQHRTLLAIHGAYRRRIADRRRGRHRRRGYRVRRSQAGIHRDPEGCRRAGGDRLSGCACRNDVDRACRRAVGAAIGASRRIWSPGWRLRSSICRSGRSCPDPPSRRVSESACWLRSLSSSRPRAARTILPSHRSSGWRRRSIVADCDEATGLAQLPASPRWLRSFTG